MARHLSNDSSLWYGIRKPPFKKKKHTLDFRNSDLNDKGEGSMSVPSDIQELL